MGGGVGLFAGASHRVCGLHSQLAMPEVAIGFFPDVGATYFLRNTQPGVERLIALSGCRIAAADMQNNDFADYIIDSQTKTDVITRLQQLPWYGDRQRDAEMVDALLLEVAAKPQQAPSVLAAISEQLEQLSGLSDLNSQYDYILSWQPTNKFITQIQQGLISASPLSLHLVNAQLQQQHLTLPECFQFELSLARQCLVHGDFKEGVRALLIDKDKSPRWRFDSLGTVKQEDIDEMLTPSFSKSAHPLAHLAE